MPDIDKLVDADPSKTNKFLEWAVKRMLPRTIKWFKENVGGTSYYSWQLSDVPDVADSEQWEDNYRLNRNIRHINDNTLRAALSPDSTSLIKPQNIKERLPPPFSSNLTSLS